MCSYSDYEFVFFAGLVIAGGAFVYSRKAVAKIILHKGGKSVYIETFGLLGLGKKHIVNLDEVRFLQVVRVHKGIYNFRERRLKTMFTISDELHRQSCSFQRLRTDKAFQYRLLGGLLGRQYGGPLSGPFSFRHDRRHAESFQEKVNDLSSKHLFCRSM